MQNKANHSWQKTAWVLVGINLVLLFWLEGGLRLFGVDRDAAREPQRLDMQIQPQAIKSLTPEEIEKANAAASEAASAASAGASASSSAQAPFVPATVALAAATLVASKKKQGKAKLKKDKSHSHRRQP
jgi:hypothetical protein